MTKHLVVLAGPTAVGKTDLSVRLAEHFNCPIVSADSRQFYKEMSVGTAKPTQEEMKDVPHFFIDSHSITTPLSAGQFENECIHLLDELFQKQDVVILTGGSGLFLKAIYDGLDDFIEISSDTKNFIQTIYDEQGIKGLQDELFKLDPDYFKKVDLQNPVRLIRALEVCKESGLPFSQQRKEKSKNRNFQSIKIILNRDREELYHRINLRVELMIQNGLELEAKSLMHFSETRALQTVGYAEWWPYFRNEYDLDRVIELIQRNSRRYAKRQLTWFKREPDFKWFHPEQEGDIKDYLETILK